MFYFKACNGVSALKLNREYLTKQTFCVDFFNVLSILLF